MGTRLAVYLSHRGEKVTLIDSDKGRCEWVSKNSDAVVYRGNVLNPSVLTEAEIMKTDTLVAALGNDQVARELIRLAKSQFGVPRVIAVTKDAANGKRMQMLGADEVICSEDVVLEEIKSLLRRRGNRVLYHGRGEDHKIEQVSVKATSGMLGKKVLTLENELARVAGVVRGGKLLFPEDTTELQMGDEVIVIGEEAGVGKVCSQIEE